MRLVILKIFGFGETKKNFAVSRVGTPHPKPLAVGGLFVLHHCTSAARSRALKFVGQRHGSRYLLKHVNFLSICNVNTDNGELQT